MAKTTDALKILKKRLGDGAQIDKEVAEEKLNVRIATMIYQARAEAGLTQSQLAELVSSKQQVIARLESADYDGHSLSMLQRIATALSCQLEISMVSETQST